MALIDSRARTVIRGLTTYTPGKPIEEVQRQFKLSSVIKLASNENALGPSPKALAALRRAASGLHRYPDSTCRDLRARLAKALTVEPDSLVFGNGSDELIVLALRAFVDPGDAVVVASPTFLIYEQQARACGAAVTVVPLKDYRYDLPAMAAAASPHTKLIFIANPDNPTGTYVTKRELGAFLRGLGPETVVFLDEAYYEFVDAADYPQTLPYVKDRPIIVTRTFSKAYGLAGLRIGYGVAQPALAAAMNAVREPFNVNSLAQAAAAAALTDTAFLARTRRLVREGRRDLVKELDALKLRHVPSVTNFILIQLGPRSSEVAAALLSRGVIVREMSAWKLSGCIRVTVGTMAENKRFVQELKRCLAR
ncbi:MAG: histidinol-phosphate transaminase [Omnitrophica WOR_2 bacterium RIFCSPHIGHO2_02_FULL_67_20]|nr:MAG: histidinol-phosphate transaminase [Omnitrophica WOR_2 bacterium RIFCSPHIGHO2_02_FULL_67_20]